MRAHGLDLLPDGQAVSELELRDVVGAIRGSVCIPSRKYNVKVTVPACNNKFLWKMARDYETCYSFRGISHSLSAASMKPA